jgi:predicted HTH transcriptional regulator
MHPTELIEMIEQGESSTVEFKRKIASPQKIAKEISAFANTRGGYLLIGVDDDRSIVGVHSEKHDVENILFACDFFLDPPVEPKISIMNLYNREIIVAFIPESKRKPNKFVKDPDAKQPEKRAYIRVGEKSVMASREMSRVLATTTDEKPLRMIVGDMEKRLFSYLEKYERATVKDFAKLVNISKRRAERLMVRLVKARVLQIHADSSSDYFTLV